MLSVHGIHGTRLCDGVTRRELLRLGQVHDASDRTGAAPPANPVTPQELTATLFHCLGLEPHTTIQDQQGRPFLLVEGTPLSALL